MRASDTRPVPDLPGNVKGRSATMQIVEFSGGSIALFQSMTGITEAVNLMQRGLSQLGPGRVREGLNAFRGVGTDFLAECDGCVGRLLSHALVFAGGRGETSVAFCDVARVLKMDEDAVRMICYCAAEHPALLRALAESYVDLGESSVRQSRDELSWDPLLPSA